MSLDGYFWWLGRHAVQRGVSVPLLSLHTPTFLDDADEFTCGNVQLTHQLALRTAQANAAAHRCVDATHRVCENRKADMFAALGQYKRQSEWRRSA